MSRREPDGGFWIVRALWYAERWQDEIVLGAAVLMWLAVVLLFYWGVL